MLEKIASNLTEIEKVNKLITDQKTTIDKILNDVGVNKNLATVAQDLANSAIANAQKAINDNITQDAKIKTNADNILLRATKVELTDGITGAKNYTNAQIEIKSGEINQTIESVKNINQINLLLDSKINKTSSDYNIHKFKLREKPITGEKYTFTIKGNLGAGKTSFAIYNSGAKVQIGKLLNLGNGYYQATLEWKNKTTDEDIAVSDTELWIYTFFSSVTVNSTIEWATMVVGVMAPLTYIEPTVPIVEFNKVRDTVNLHEQSIGNINGNISRMIQTDSLIQQDIKNAQNGLQTVQNQLAGSWAVQNLNKNGDVIAQINLIQDVMKIQAKFIQLDGDVSMTTAFTDKLFANYLTANSISAMMANFANIIAQNIDVNNISGNKALFAQVLFNGVNSRLKIDGTGVNVLKNDGSTGANFNDLGLQLFENGAISSYLETQNVKLVKVDMMANGLSIGVTPGKSIFLGSRYEGAGFKLMNSAVTIAASSTGDHGLDLDIAKVTGKLGSIDFTQPQGIVFGSSRPLIVNTQLRMKNFIFAGDTGYALDICQIGNGLGLYGANKNHGIIFNYTDNDINFVLNGSSYSLRSILRAQGYSV